MNRVSEIEEVASLWIVREDRGLTTEESYLKQVWLDESDEHAVAYLRLKSLWQFPDQEISPQYGYSRFRNRVLAKLMDARLIAAAIMVVVVVGAISVYHDGGRRPTIIASTRLFVTGTDQQKTVNLTDGTRVDLNQNTRIQTEVSASARTITLDQGEVYLEIAHDPSRPFVVLAGNRRITDLGTKFSVLRQNDYIKVIVKEGRVKIEELGAQVGVVPIVADKGQIAVLKGDETLLASKGTREIEDDLNWRNQMLVFNQEALIDVAAEFNHYNKKQILVEGKAREIRIGGRFRSDNLQAFVLLMRNAFDLKVTEKRDQIIISD